MRKSWYSNLWRTGILAGTLIVIGAALCRPSVSAPPPGRYDPEFKVGDVAPDFSLPDSQGARRTLSTLVRRDTLVCFACGCSSCLEVQTFLAKLVQKMGPKAPDFISVTSMPVEREETWFRDTRLKQTVLYEARNGPVMELYRGHPCPRLYRLNGERRVEWIGASPANTISLRNIKLGAALVLGFPPSVVDAPE